MIVRVINQPFGGTGQRLGDELEAMLRFGGPRFDHVYWVCAFAHFSGVGRLVDAIRDFRARGGTIGVVVGINYRGTSWEALQTLLQETNEVYIYTNPGTNTFHPKVFLFELTCQRGVAFVGSNNLTMAGLYLNNEAAVCLDLDLKNASEAQTFLSLRNIFEQASDQNSGTVRRLDAQVLDQLYQADTLLREGDRAPRGQRLQDQPEYRLELAADQAGQVQAPLFTRVPVPPASPLHRPMPVAPPLAVAQTTVQQRTVALPSSHAQPAPATDGTFVMVLGDRDTRQLQGYSRDIYIPLAARDSHSDFWGWDSAFTTRSTPNATYEERFLTILVRPVVGPVHRREEVRLYYYDRKHEFRLNCGVLVNGASPGDILVVGVPQPGATYNDQSYDYEATVIPQGHTSFAAYNSACSEAIGGSSPKRWGYVGV